MPSISKMRSRLYFLCNMILD